MYFSGILVPLFNRSSAEKTGNLRGNSKCPEPDSNLGHYSYVACAINHSATRVLINSFGFFFCTRFSFFPELFLTQLIVRFIVVLFSSFGSVRRYISERLIPYSISLHHFFSILIVMMTTCCLLFVFTCFLFQSLC